MSEHHAHNPERSARAKRRARREADDAPSVERLMEEINLLRLEGALFCFDKRAAVKRRGRLTFKELRERPVTIILTDFGQPSFVAYRVLNAILLRLTEQGCVPSEDGRCFYDDTVSFESGRELARLAGYSDFGNRTSELLYRGVMQLRNTGIHCAWYDKETKEWSTASFNLLTDAMFSGEGEKISRCVFKVHERIMASVNRRHVATFNMHRLHSLDAIGLVMYKRIFFHLSNLYTPKADRTKLKYWKAYEAICAEWLGGLKPERYISRILSNQLGKHLDAIKGTGLMREYSITKNAEGKFILTFYPGDRFFADYELYYLDRKRGQFHPPHNPDARALQAPFELVAAFHQALGRDRRYFQDNEVACAEELLREHSAFEIRDLICYAVEKARATKFEMEWFNAIRIYRNAWREDRAQAGKRAARLAAITDCAECNSAGQIVFRGRTGGVVPMECPHDRAEIEAIEARLGLKRL